MINLRGRLLFACKFVCCFGVVCCCCLLGDGVLAFCGEPPACCGLEGGCRLWFDDTAAAPATATPPAGLCCGLGVGVGALLTGIGPKPIQTQKKIYQKYRLKIKIKAKFDLSFFK